MNKKQFAVSAMGTEVLAEMVIEATTEEEAREKYFDLWCAGQVVARDYELEDYEVREVPAEGEGDA
jgi:hypothetical protein